ncbi:virulence factor TspB C-terminal domain-related protein [Stenotrophomonas rhizophila]|uniref:virulence factor TspB C-terminal domain-related protein n=1 Tax=Stenotrophomonas rhizophila TaxID=216778 RepID=UPI0028B1AF01|nr:virulence factor TspB C-terminal domain-related protein [Stenotrophomonas rhizophila]
MNWIARIVVSVIIRRILYAATALLLAWCSIDGAAAQSKSCASEADECNAAEALAACESYPLPPPTQTNIVSITRRNCTLRANSKSGFHDLSYWGRNAAGSEIGMFSIQGFYYKNNCATEPSKVTPFFPPSGSMRCVNGCEVTYRQNADDTSTYSANGKICQKKPDCAAQGKNMVWNAMLGVCQPVEPECPAGKVLVGNACTDEKPCPDGMALVNGSCKKKDEECPAGMTRSPLGNCVPGDGQCASGEVRGKDGTCKRDKDGDGEPDEGEEDGEGPDGTKVRESFSGGDECDAPPSCSGSPVMCGQARIQWRIDCNTRRRVNISGGQCTQAGTPVCTGKECNAMEYSQLLMAWRSACAAEKLLAKGSEGVPGTSTTDANGNGVADALEGSGDPISPGDGNADVAGAKKWGIGVSTSLLNSENIFGSGSCPEPPSFTMMGATISGADFPYFCQLASIMRGLILIFGAFAAVKILMGWGFSG